ncbi:hypothetical protein BZG02_08475 [Labilibaculum filiforme]|uniref:Thioredoxin domain-containing protein n=1 Tax=Labilibaculum filiforme TaxID=1940526 RepID=A0A2N3HZB7_9BACT|nr:TlpA disulfide reductase family protein [Labilibaculum filiforme]PKQ63410.1 hypothetical protein BZG02_08475 [Labilibaculum filiforme]
MKNKNWKKSILPLLAVCFALSVFGQSPVKLKVGDVAPELRGNWIKGTPVEYFENDKLYVVEFWATWCGPCRAAMPHLSELAKKYADKVNVIGVNVWEDHKNGKELYETSLPSVKKFVLNMGDKMAYNVLMDNNDQYMANNWMVASGQYGIPASFLIKKGKIIWIGQPTKLDKIIEEVMTGTYKMKADESKKRDEKLERTIVSFQDLAKRVSEAIATEDYSEALNDIDSTMSTIDPEQQLPFYSLKFTTLLECDVHKALVFANEWKKMPSASSFIGSIIASKDELSKEVYQYGVGIFTEMLSDNSVKPVIFHYMAQCYFKMDDVSNAIASEEKAIELGKEAIASGELQGMINDSTIDEYQEALARYKASQK